MADILGPASDNAVTVRPARTITRGDTDTWFADCSGPDADDGTAFSADFFNDALAQLRSALSSSGINRDGADTMLWRAMQSVGIRYAADSGSANNIVIATTPPLTTLSAGKMFLILLANDVTGATNAVIDGLDPVDLKWPDGTALAAGDAKEGALLLCGFDGTTLQLLCKMNGAGAGPNLVPGQIIMWPLDTPPTGTLECNGAAVSRTDYARLFAVIGTAYGPGNGTTTFDLPDYRSEFLRGWDHGKGGDPNAATRTNRGDTTTGDHVGTKEAGAAGPVSLSGATVSLNNPQIVTSGGYNGAIKVSTNGSGDGTEPNVAGKLSFQPNTYVNLQKITGTIDIVGNSGSPETRPRNVNVLYAIAY